MTRPTNPRSGKAVVDGKEAGREQLYDAFRVLDRDGSGFLERSELMDISTCRCRPPLPTSHTAEASIEVAVSRVSSSPYAHTVPSTHTHARCAQC